MLSTIMSYQPTMAAVFAAMVLAFSPPLSPLHYLFNTNNPTPQS